MKSICALLLMLSLNGYGQSELQLGTISTDTVKIIMLCSDTLTGYLPAIIDHTNKIYADMHKHSLFWDYGYSVVSNINFSDVEFDQDGNLVQTRKIEHLYYLDKNKKPLPKNILVWQTKETEGISVEDWIEFTKKQHIKQ